MTSGVKPSYLGLLNAVANGEAVAASYLADWLAITTDPDVRDVLRTVAAREAEHAASFAKRIVELGFEVRSREPQPDEVRSAAIARSSRSDLEKLEALGLGGPYDPSEPDVFDRFLSDHTIDPATGALLGRYVAEERDSDRLLRGCWERLRTSASAAG